MKVLKALAWEIAETLRRAVTPFFISMMVGMVMLALLGIEIPAFSGIVNVLLAAGDLVLMFFLLMGIGEFAGKMKAAGQLKDPCFAEGKSAGDKGVGKYRPCKEYRPSKGFVIGAVACIIPAVLIVVGGVTGSSGVRFAMMIVCGWAYIPVYGIRNMAGISQGLSGEALNAYAADAAGLWPGFIMLALLIVVCGVAYIVGGRKEEMRQLQLQRQSETMEKIEKFRSGKRSQEYAERKGEKKQ